jgi:hypothetical protein
MGTAYNPTIYQYSSWEIILNLTTPQNTPFILTDYTGESQIRPFFGSKTVLASPTVIITNPTSGEITVHLTKEQTAALLPTTGTNGVNNLPVWDVLLSKTNGYDAFIVIQGQVTVLPGVTQWQTS